MSRFKLPTTLCYEIETLIRKFWWGQRGNQRKVHGVRWEDLCNHKDQEGMGFKDLIMFNEAMLAKLSWQLRQDDNSLFLDAKESASASYAWRSILHGRDVILKGALWRVGDGKQIKIWGDNWLPTKFQPKVTSPMIFGQQNSSVEALINQLTRSQKNEVIDHCFNSTEAAVIKSIPLSSSP